MISIICYLFLATFQASARPLSHVCPPPEFDSFPNLNLSSFISKPWFVQKQTPLAYQPQSTFFCVRAFYVPFNASDLNKGLRVFNYANRLKVNGNSMGSGIANNKSSTVFQMAAVPNSLVFPPNRSFSGKPSNPLTEASKLIVGGERAALAAAKRESPVLNNLDRSLGPYWIVWYQPDLWAIISGGPPVYAGKNSTCTAINPNLSTPLQYRGGLWIFTRQPNDPISTQAALEKMKSLGLDTSQLVVVEQRGCKYEGAIN